MKRILTSIAVSVLLSGVSALGQSPVLVGGTYGESVTSIKADREGKICFSSLRGLYTYDGTEIMEIIGSTNVLDFLPQNDGTFWIATPSFIGHWTPEEGVVRYQSTMFGDNKTLCDLSQSELIFTNDTGIYILDKENGETVSSYAFSFPENTFVVTDGRDGDYVLASANNTFLVFNRSLELVKRMDLGEGSSIGGIVPLSDGSVVLGSRSGLLRADMDELSLRPFGGGPAGIVSVAPYGEDSVLCFTEEGGIFVVGSSGGAERISSFSGVTPSGMCTFALDRSHVWLSGSRMGLYGLVIHRDGRPGFLDDLVLHSEGKRIQGIAEDAAGRIWFLENGALSVFDKNTGRVTEARISSGLDGQDIRAFMISSDNKVWLATNDYLGRFSISGDALTAEQIGRFEGNMVYRIVEDVDGSIRFASYYNQYEYSDKSSFMTLEGELPVPVAADPSRNFYLEYRSDRVSFRRGGTMREGLPVLDEGAAIVDALLSRNGDVWCLTTDRKVLRIGGEDASRDEYILPDWKLSSSLPYFEYAFYSLEEDDLGNIWIGSAYGLVKLDPSEGGGMSYYNTSNRYDYYTTSFKDSEGNLYFAFSNGLTVFSSDDLGSLFSNCDIRYYIDHLLVNDVPYQGDLSSPAVFDYNENSFAFKCIDINYDHLSIRYKYTLEGYEDEWHDMRNRYVSYPGLPHGKYVFKFRADGTPDDMVKSFSFTVRQKPWLRWWAILAYAAIALLSALTLWRWYRKRKETAAREEKMRIQREVDKAKIDLFTNLSHEIRTPLSLIVAPLGDLERSSVLTPADRKSVDLVSRSARELLDLTNQILGNDLSSNTVVRRERNDIRTQIEKAVGLFTPIAIQKRQTILVESPHMAFDFDGSKFSRIMSNLLSNAIKYSLDPGTITVSTAILDKSEAKSVYGRPFDTKMVEVRVSDQGPGIPEGETESIFSRHTRKNSGGVDVQGFGIGLNYVRELVNLQDGAIKAENAPGGGAVFKFVLPVPGNSYEILGDEPAVAPENPGKDISPEGNGLLGGCSILIVEDNPDMRMYLGELFSFCGKVLTAEDGLSALDILRKEYVDIVLSDVMMDRMDGFRLCAAIKEDSDLCSVSVILLTAKTDVASQIKGLHTGADAYVLKPFISEYLLAVAESVMRNRAKLQTKVQNVTSESLAEESSEESGLSPLDKIFMEKFSKALDERLKDEEINVNVLHKELGMSRTSFYMKVKSLTGLSPIQYINQYRMNKALALLKSRMYSIKEIAYMLGYQTRQSFTTRFKYTFGVSPTKYLGEGADSEEED